jgi:hypothetical protein
MKKARRTVVALGLVLSMALIMVGTAAADLPGGGWWSGEQIQNVGTDTGTVQIVAYGSGTSYSGDTRELDDGASTTYLPNDFSGMTDGFQGAAVVSSDQPIKAIVNVTNKAVASYGITGGMAAAQYQGIDGEQADTTIGFPLVKNDYYGKTTTFYVQNAGGSTATITATYKVDAGSYDKTYSIDPNEMVVVNPGDAGVPSGATSIGALTVTSDQDIAGVVMEHPTSESPATVLQATRGFVPGDFDSKIYAPIVKKGYYGRSTGIQVQNVNDSGNVNVTVTYYPVDGCSGSYSDTKNNLPAGESYTFFQSTMSLPSGCYASAEIEATGGNIAGVVNETFYPLPAGTNQAQTTYSCVPDSAATAKIAVPLYKNRYYGKTTGLQVQCVGGSDCTVDLVFTDSDTGTAYTLSDESISSGAAQTYLLLDNYSGNWDVQPQATEKYIMGVIVESTNGQPVVAIANESVFPFSAGGQDKNCYEGFNLTP